MAVKKRSWPGPDGKRRNSWQADFYAPDGKRVRKSGFPTRREAEEWERAERARLDEEARLAALPAEVRRLATAAERTLAELSREWLDAVKHGLHGGPAIEARTYTDYEGSVRLHINPRIGNLRLADIDGPAVADFRARLLKEVSRAKAQRVLKHLRQMLNFAVLKGYLAANPAVAVRIITDSREKPAMRMPTDEQVLKLIQAAQRFLTSALAEAERCRRERPRDEAAGKRYLSTAQSWQCFALLIKTAALTGLRISELRALTWDHVSLNGPPFLKVEQRADQLNRIGKVKSRAAYRSVMLPESLAGQLRAWRAQCPPGPAGLVFPAPEGGLLSDSNLRSRFLRPAMAEAGLIDERGKAAFSFHGLRHYRASVLISEQLNPKEVQVELGHSDSGLTLNAYAHLFKEEDERRRRAAEAAATRLETEDY